MTILDKKITITMNASDWYVVFAAFGIAMAFIVHAADDVPMDRLQQVMNTIRTQITEQTKEVPKP